MPDFSPGFRGCDRYGDYVVLAVEGDERIVRYDDGREARRSLAVLRLAHDNRQRAAAAPPPPVAPPPPTRRRASRSTADVSFFIDEVLPVVARLIHQLAGDPPDYVTHAQLTAAFLTDPAGRRLVDRARAIQERTPEQTAANMIAWFGQAMTVERSPYQRDFDRRKIGRRYAYRPRTADR